MLLSAIRPIILALVILFPCVATAQTSIPAGGAPDLQQLKPAELDQLVAPIALYPDALLAEVLMASAYPLDVVQAERWLEANKTLTGDQLKAAVDKQPWDDSVKSLVATPSVLEMMSAKLDWTERLGDAVVAQQADVMDAIQRLRAKAQANNKLSSTKEQTVTVQQQPGGQQVIAIEPTDPNTVYVPYYDPAVVYGDWPYSDYPPYYFPAPGYIGTGILAAGIAFGTGYGLGRWVGGGRYWGGGVNWRGNNIVVNRPTGGNSIGNRWQPRVEHRQRAGNRTGGRQQLNFRGSGGQQVLKPGGGRSNLGGRNAPANRPTARNGPSRGGHHVAHTNRGANRGASHARAGGNRGGGARVNAGAGRVHAGGGGRGGGMRAGGGHGGGMRAGGGGGFRGGGGRGSDIRLKHDIVLLGYLDNGLGFYRFSYNGGDEAYVGVMAQEVQRVMPAAVVRGSDGYLRVYYEKLGLKFQRYEQWLESGAKIPAKMPSWH
jgi:hypothetical protein